MKVKQEGWREFIPEAWNWRGRRYSWALFKADLLAGLTVGVVALPLGMAFAIASGVSPERGIYTTIIAGFLISLLGGSRLQIGGATGAFVVIIYGIVQRNGYEGLVIVTLMAGVILLIGAFSRLGSLIKYVPYPLITGFTTGIAVIIFSSQIKDFFGLHLSSLPADFIPQWIVIIQALPGLHFPTVLVAAVTLGLIIVLRRFCPIIPWGITSIAIATAVTWGFALPIDTIATRFGDIPRTLPLPHLPTFVFSFASIHELIPDAITVAFLAGIESLLSCIVADGMAGTKHQSNCELMGQGIANITSVLFGGIPATGAIARTAANIKTGAQTPIAGMIHAVTVLIIVLACAPIVSQIPLAALSALLMMVAWNMSELHHFRHLLKAPKGDIAILLTTFSLTVLVDLTTAVLGGVILALFLVMKNVEEMTKVFSIKGTEKHAHIDRHLLPAYMEVYEITGPFFFGVADRLKHVLSTLEFPPKVFVLYLENVPWVDASGMHALREFHAACRHEGIELYLVGAHHSLLRSFKKFKIDELIGAKHICHKIDEVLRAH